MSDRFVLDIDVNHSELANNDLLVRMPVPLVVGATLTVRRDDGSWFILRACKPEDGYLIEWAYGPDREGANDEFLMTELVRRANEHYAIERLMASD